MEKEEIFAVLNEAYFSAEHHEREALEHLPELLEGARFFVDVGASLGQYTLFAGRVLKEGRILAVEADPLRHEELVRNCEKLRGQTKVELQPVLAAAAESDGEASFFVTHSNVSGGLFPHEVNHQRVQWSEITVPARSLDSLCGGLMPDLVKIDVEGSELRVLRGAERILREGRTQFLVEIHPWVDPAGQQGPQDVRRFMRSRGYHPVPFHGHTLFTRRAGRAFRYRLRHIVSGAMRSFGWLGTKG